MKNVYITVQVIFVLGVLIISTAFTWYDGSNIVNHPFDWNNTAIFTKFFSGVDVIYNEYDISQLDYFVYAAKIHATSFKIMMISLFYLTALLIYIAMKIPFKRKN